MTPRAQRHALAAHVARLVEHRLRRLLVDEMSHHPARLVVGERIARDHLGHLLGASGHRPAPACRNSSSTRCSTRFLTSASPSSLVNSKLPLLMKVRTAPKPQASPIAFNSVLGQLAGAGHIYRADQRDIGGHPNSFGEEVHQARPAAPRRRLIIGDALDVRSDAALGIGEAVADMAIGVDLPVGAARRSAPCPARPPPRAGPSGRPSHDRRRPWP